MAGCVLLAAWTDDANYTRAQGSMHERGFQKNGVGTD